MTRHFYNLNLLVKLTKLLHQIQFNLAIATTAVVILMLIYAEQVPSLHRVAPRYLKQVTSSNFWLFTLMSALIFMLLVISFIFFFLC